MGVKSCPAVANRTSPGSEKARLRQVRVRPMEESGRARFNELPEKEHSLQQCPAARAQLVSCGRGRGPMGVAPGGFQRVGPAHSRAGLQDRWEPAAWAPRQHLVVNNSRFSGPGGSGV